MRFVFLINLLMGAAYLYLCIAHIIGYISKGTNYKTFCDSYYPCAFFYSRFSSSFNLAYAGTSLAFTVLGWFFCTHEWIKSDEAMQNFKLYNQDNVAFTRSIFNGWDWSRSTERESNDQLALIDRTVKLFLNEDITKIKIIDRSNAQKSGLVMLRIITGLGTVAVMACGWGAIGFICYYENAFYKLIPVPFLNTFAPMALVPCVSLVIKPILKMIVYMEAWDFEH